MPGALSGKDAITLVIGQAEGDGAVCEGFAFDQIRAAIDQIRPVHVVGVGAFPIPGTPEFDKLAPLAISVYGHACRSLYLGSAYNRPWIHCTCRENLEITEVS